MSANSEQQQSVETLKLALYGEWSTGKTEQIRWLTKLVGPENVLILSAEGGLGTIKSVIERQPEMVIRVNNLTGTIRDEVAKRKAIIDGQPMGLRDAWSVFKDFAAADRNHWVVVDGGSEILSWIANEQISNTEALYDLRCTNRAIPDHLQPYGRFINDKGNIQMPQIYGRIGRDIENLLAAWTGLPCNLMWNFLEDMTGSNGFEKTPPYGPHVPGKVGLRAVMGSFDFVGRMMRREGKCVVGFRSTPMYMARVRADWEAGIKIPNEIADFRLDSFIKLISGNNTEAAQ